MPRHSSAETGDGEPVASAGAQVIRHVPGDLPRDPRSGRRRGADRAGNSCMPGGFRALPGQDGRPFGQQYPGGIASRYEVPYLVVHLEGRVGRVIWAPGPVAVWTDTC